MVLILKLCSLNNVLPQGAPTSPYLSNLRMIALDEIISKYTSQKSIRYTRYADDLTFSGDFNPHLLINDISTIVKHRIGDSLVYHNARYRCNGVI